MTGQNLVFRTVRKRKKYNAKEFFEFTKDRGKNSKDKNVRYELIDGRICLMASPSTGHQSLILSIGAELQHYFKGKKCRPFIAPLDVVLFEKNKEKRDDSQNVFQPDVFVVCSSSKISKNRINGAPDFVIEVVSPSNPEADYFYKLNMYMKYGVKEYWIVNPELKQISVYIRPKKDDDVQVYFYTFEDKIKVSIFEDLELDFKEIII